MNFSPRVEKIVFGAKGLKILNYREYVQYTKREFQLKCLPKAAYKTIMECSEAIVKSGVIRDKFYDEDILKLIDDENVRKAMKVKYVPESEYESYKRKIGLRFFEYEDTKKMKHKKMKGLGKRKKIK